MTPKASKSAGKRRKDATPFDDIDAVDRVVHEPARLAIMAYLSVLEEADFVYLMNETGLTRGNLSSHMSKLEDAGYVQVVKSFHDNRPRTLMSLTSAGRRALESWREHMSDVLAALQ